MRPLGLVYCALGVKLDFVEKPWILSIQILELDSLFLHLILATLAGDRARVVCNFSCKMQLQCVKSRVRDYVYRSMRQKE